MFEITIKKVDVDWPTAAEGRIVYRAAFDEAEWKETCEEVDKASKARMSDKDLPPHILVYELRFGFSGVRRLVSGKS